MAKTHIRFDDGVDRYESSDSETNHTEREKSLLKKVRTRHPKNSDSEEEVYNLHGENEFDDEESSQIDLAESDIEDQEDDNLPDIKAWGKSKNAFYSTDYVDPDYGGYQGKDALAADLEEKEARAIQQRLAQQLDDDDFGLDIFTKKSEEISINNEEVIKSDLLSLSKRQILELLQKESPEFFGLVQDFKEKMEEVKCYLLPVIELDKLSKIPECEALDFVKTKYHLILNYCTNIYMYLLLKASTVNVQSHPVIKRLYQYRQLLAQMQPIYVEIIKPQIELLTELYKENEDMNVSKPIKTKKKISRKLELLKKLDVTESLFIKQKKQVSFELPQPTQLIKTEIDSVNNGVENELEKVIDLQEGSKRAITYQMAKNKGLTSRRKKEQCNPRVKHRNKFRKAKIRRKGAVREVRNELSRYGGEISGIKTSVSKSIKLK